MADSHDINKLNPGVSAWNEWRKNYRGRPDLKGMDLRGMDLRSADLSSVDLIASDLSTADLRSANLNAAILSGAKVVRSNLSYARLHGADLIAANFDEATLIGADLSAANLHRAIMPGADLAGADLRRSRLDRANLSGTNLRRADLSGADLRDTKFDNATIGNTIFANNDLRGAKGLDRVLHDGPSSVGVDTIYRSLGQIPLPFLRGCGVPENLIAYMPSLVAPGAINFYSCFISYSTKDQEFADRLFADLQNKGVRCWFAPHDVQGGKKLHEQIDDAIRMHERLLLIVSQDSIASEWVKTEIRKARKRERQEGKRVLFPVRLVSFDAIRNWELFCADEGKDLATEIREYYIPDFSEWKNHDPYQKEFEKLLRDLRTEEDKAG